jgi:hypothetical protein
MSGWLSRILGRGRNVPVEQIAGAIGTILERVQSLQEYRAALAQAAARGDLDAAFNTFQAANRRARDFIENG